jgi:multidrug efflux pump subunit AcrB
VLAIGLVVDDSIVVLENIHRRLVRGEPALVASYRGARQVGFAVVATTLVLIAVFIPSFSSRAMSAGCLRSSPWPWQSPWCFPVSWP